MLSGKAAYEALTDEEKTTISDWQATLDPRNPTPTVLEESDDEDDEDDAEDSDDDADDSDEEVPDAASYMTVAAATITAVGAILI